jgi:hypothetical protein
MLETVFFTANLISITPENINGDLVITNEQIQQHFVT